MAARESSRDVQQIDIAGPTAIGDALASVQRFAEDQCLGGRDQARLSIIVEELVTNLCEHGVCDLEHEISLQLVRHPSAIAILIEDNGEPFDPRSASDSAEIPSRGGGAGLRLVRSWSEFIDYETQGGRNRLRLEMPLTGR